MAVETTGQRVRRLRLERDWTQTDLAYKSGVGYATISRIERGVETKRHNRSTLVALASALGVSVEALRGDG